MKIIFYLSVLTSIFVVSQSVFGQLTTTTLSATQDSYTDSKYPTTPYGSNTTMKSGTYYYQPPKGRAEQSHQRVYVDFNLSSIPVNAVIYSAKLKLRRSSGITANFNWKTKHVEESWLENTVTASNQPDITVLANNIVTTAATVASIQEIDVKDMVQRMVYGSLDNYGWCVQVENEGLTANSGAWFYTSEHSQTSRRPQLEVKYYLPHELANVVVTHESGSLEQDGSIDLDILNGSQNFSWEWFDSAGDLLSTDSLLENVGAGWYRLHIQGVSHPDEHFYYSFIVGRIGEEVNIDIKPDADFTLMAKVSDQVQSGIDYGDVNYGNYSEFIAKRQSVSGIYHNERSFMKFKLWIDEDIQFEKADLFLDGKNHAGFLNSAELHLVEANWNENAITNNFKPATSSSIDVDINGVSSPTQNTTVDVSQFWNYWRYNNRRNHGFYFKLQLEPNLNVKQVYYSPNETQVDRRPEFQFTVNVSPKYATVNWDPDTGVGSVKVDVSSESAFSGPYLYMLSSDSIPEADSLLATYTSSSMAGDADQFYGHYVSNTVFRFDGNPAATYFLSVFDQNDGRIFQEKVTVQEPLTLENTNGLKVLESDRIGVTGTSGVGDLNVYTYDGRNSAVLVKTDNIDDEQFFGYASVTTAIVDYTDIYYGFRIVNGNLNVIENGVLGAFISSVDPSDEIELRDDQGALSLWINGVSQDTYAAPVSYDHKLGLGMEIKTTMIVKPAFMYSFVRRPYRFKSSTWRYFNCSGVTGGFTFKVTPAKNPVQACSMSYTIKDSDGVTVNSGTSTSGTSILINQNSLGDPLEPGIYTVEGSMNCSGTIINFSQEVLLGYEVEWTALNNYDYDNVNKLLERDVITLGQTYANARSSNTLKYSEAGIIEFSLNTNVLVDGAKHMFRVNTTDPNVQPNAFQMLDNHFFRVFSHNGVRYFEIWDADNGWGQSFIPINANSRIRLHLKTNPNEIDVFVNGSQILSASTLTRPSNLASVLRPNTLQLDDAFVDVVSTFGCPEPQVQYAHLDYEMDGYYSVMKKGKIRFVYDQQYDADNLTFNIYNYRDELVKTQADFPVVSTTHGKNYITLDVSDDTNCLGRGFFYLEAITSKNEKLYLRYFNDFTHPDCIDYYADPGEPTE